jgi:serine/threonine protein kinase
VKVADFGLSRKIHGKYYYKVKNENLGLPLKWMSSESMKNLKFDAKTDVWSYDVVVWKLMTRGSTPYENVKNILQYLKDGKHLPIPECCPKKLFEILLKC